MRRKVFASLLLSLIIANVAAKEEVKDFTEEITKRVETRPLSILRIDDIREVVPAAGTEAENGRQDPQQLLLQQQQLLQQQYLQQKLILQLQQNQLDLKEKLGIQKQQQKQQLRPVDDLDEFGESVVIKNIDLSQLLAQKYAPTTAPSHSHHPHRNHHHHHRHHSYHNDDTDEDDGDDYQYYRPRPPLPHHHYQPPPGYGYYGPYPAPPSNYYYQTPYPFYPSYYSPYGSYDYRYPYGGGYLNAPSPYGRSAKTPRKKKLKAPAGVIPLTAAILRAGVQERSATGGDVQATVENTEKL